MPRDLLYLPQEGGQLVLATDCSSCIGMKDNDLIKASYEVTSYYLARVVLMELISVRAKPMAYTLNSSFADHWTELRKGIETAFKQIGQDNPLHIGSSEKNFPGEQTSIGITLLGKIDRAAEKPSCKDFAVIGIPLVGQELLENETQSISLEECLTLSQDLFIGEMLPVGSRGIRQEFETHFHKGIESSDSTLDLDKSAGPSSCLIVSYLPDAKNSLQVRFGNRISFLDLVG